MDLTSLIGSLLVIVLLIGGIMYDASAGFLASNLQYFLDVPSVFIVIGGSFSALVLAFPGTSLKGLGSAVGQVYKPSRLNQIQTLMTIVDLSKIARKNIFSLEDAMPTVENTYLRGGLRMIVDRVERTTMVETLISELKYKEVQGERNAHLMSFLATLSPSFGMIGTLIGLVVLLQNLDNPDKIGPSMAVALITTLYGAIFANALFLPWSNRIKMNTEDEKVLNEMIRDAVLLMHRLERPEVIEGILLNYMPSGMQKKYEQIKWGDG